MEPGVAMRGALLLVLGLAGCGEGTALGSLSSEVTGVARQIAGRPAEVSRVTASDAAINGSPDNILLVETESTGSRAGLVLTAINRDTITWRSGDGVVVQTRGGQLAGTAGFGFDLASAEVPLLGGRGVRDHWSIGGDERMHRTRYVCEARDAGAETVQVTGRSFATRRIVEVCQGEDGQAVENTYWIDGVGVARRSRQYATPEIGYLVLEDVHTGLR